METDSEKADGGMGVPGGALAADGIRQLGGVRVVKASEFKAKCLQLMDEVAASGEEIVITKRGRPVSRLAPYREKSKMVFGRNKENIRSHDDIVEPMPAEWFEDGDTAGDLF